MVIIYRAQDVIEAHIVAGLLNADDIESSVSGDYLQGGIGELAVSGFANVHVSDENVEKAKRVIAEYENKTNKKTISPDEEINTSAPKWFVFVVPILFIIIVYFLLTV